MDRQVEFFSIKHITFWGRLCLQDHIFSKFRLTNRQINMLLYSSSRKMLTKYYPRGIIGRTSGDFLVRFTSGFLITSIMVRVQAKINKNIFLIHLKLFQIQFICIANTNLVYFKGTSQQHFHRLWCHNSTMTEQNKCIY